MMRVTTKEWSVVRLDTCEQVNKGDLALADDDTGMVEWIDRKGIKHSTSLGPHAIRIIRSYPCGR
jgi:hypothetical protein